jgi:hypothetical protein
MLDQNLCNYAKSIVAKEGYTKEEQQQFMSRLERACLDNPDLPPSFVMNCLLSIGETRLELFVPAKS